MTILAGLGLHTGKLPICFKWQLLIETYEVSLKNNKTRCWALVHYYKSLSVQVITCEKKTPSIPTIAIFGLRVVVLHIF